jgi:hypothetical protein
VSIIAYALSSTMYIEGLAKVNYMDLGSNILHGTGQEQNDDFIIPSKIHLSGTTDVLNMPNVSD